MSAPRRPFSRVPSQDDLIWSGSEFLGPDWVILDREGDQGNSEQQGYSPSNVTLNGSGNLEIKAEVASSHGHPYRSGMLQWKTFSFQYGTIEVRAKLAGGTGPWPAIWLLGTGCELTNPTTADNGGTCQWPNRSNSSSEIDFVEVLGAAPHTALNCRIHTDAGLNEGASPSVGLNLEDAFHVFTLVWSSGQLIWKLDGSTVHTLNSANVPAHPMFLIMNVAVGGVGGGSVTDATLPQSTLVDYVSVVPA